MPKVVRFNINGYIRVCLTGRGREIWRDYWAELSAFAGFPVGTTQDQPNADGWLKIQAWEAMHIFGPHMVMGTPEPWAMVIEILTPD